MPATFKEKTMSNYIVIEVFTDAVFNLTDNQKLAILEECSLPRNLQNLHTLYTSALPQTHLDGKVFLLVHTLSEKQPPVPNFMSYAILIIGRLSGQRRTAFFTFLRAKYRETGNSVSVDNFFEMPTFLTEQNQPTGLGTIMSQINPEENTNMNTKSEDKRQKDICVVCPFPFKVDDVIIGSILKALKIDGSEMNTAHVWLNSDEPVSIARGPDILSMFFTTDRSFTQHLKYDRYVSLIPCSPSDKTGNAVILDESSATGGQYIYVSGLFDFETRQERRTLIQTVTYSEMAIDAIDTLQRGLNCLHVLKQEKENSTYLNDLKKELLITRKDALFKLM